MIEVAKPAQPEEKLWLFKKFHEMFNSHPKDEKASFEFRFSGKSKHAETDTEKEAREKAERERIEKEKADKIVADKLKAKGNHPEIEPSSNDSSSSGSNNSSSSSKNEEENQNSNNNKNKNSGGNGSNSSSSASRSVKLVDQGNIH